MSSEWKRASWVFSPITLSHTYQHIINAIDDQLVATGWVLASWSGALGADNYYLRPDRYRLDLRSTKWGPSGNAAVSVTGAALSKADIAGGAFGATASVRAEGYVALSAQPVDGDTVTITDGVLTKTFEFDNTGTVAGGNVQVTIGSTIENSIENLSFAVNAQGFALTVVPHWHWWYTGDNYYQHSGLRVQYVAGSPNTVQITTFLENSGKTASQTTCTTVVSIAYDITQDNTFLFISGEDGFYVEGGTDASNNNVAHGMIFAFYPDETFGGTRDRERTWLSQGGVYELRGLLVGDRNYRFVETVGDRRNHTSHITAGFTRGSDSILSKRNIDNRLRYFGPRDHLFASIYRMSDGTVYPRTFYHTLGLMQSNFDDLYRVSMLALLQGESSYDVVRYSTGAETVGGSTSGLTYVFDTRNAIRAIPKFGVCSSYLLPWNNITDKRTGQVFRVAQVYDGGRIPNICIVWPDATNVVTIAATP